MDKADTVMDALEKEISLYRELAESFERSCGALTGMSVQEIIAVTISQEDILSRIRENVKNRGEISRIMDGLAGAGKGRASVLLERLRDVVGRVEAARAVNIRLIDEALARIDGALQVLGGAGACACGYGPGRAGSMKPGLIRKKF